jgi:hypothetical protein
MDIESISNSNINDEQMENAKRRKIDTDEQNGLFKMNFRGVEIITTIATIRSHHEPDNLFFLIYKNSNMKHIMINGAYYFDRDSRNIHAILNWLQNGTMGNSPPFNDFIGDMKYYGLYNLMKVYDDIRKIDILRSNASSSNTPTQKVEPYFVLSDLPLPETGTVVIYKYSSLETIKDIESEFQREENLFNEVRMQHIYVSNTTFEKWMRGCKIVGPVGIPSSFMIFHEGVRYAFNTNTHPPRSYDAILGYISRAKSN